MISREVTFQYIVHPDQDSLSLPDKELVEKANEALNSAYAPYSKFNVGVAIRTTEENIVTGSNQENGSFPVGQCAERVALYRLVHDIGRKAIDSIAIIVENEHHHAPASPCGSCRQLLTEYRNHQATPVRLLLASKKSKEIFEINDVADLLPLSFDGTFLGQ
jgi:cytidine deaminase